MYTILVPSDNSEDRSTAQTKYITSLPIDAEDVKIVLTHVIEGSEKEAPKEMQRPDRVETVRRTKEYLEENGYDVSVDEASMPPAEGILELAEERDVDQIVMGGRKRSPAGKALFGSVTQKVILESSVPVVVTGSQAEE